MSYLRIEYIAVEEVKGVTVIEKVVGAAIAAVSSVEIAAGSRPVVPAVGDAKPAWRLLAKLSVIGTLPTNGILVRVGAAGAIDIGVSAQAWTKPCSHLTEADRMAVYTVAPGMQINAIEAPAPA